MEIYPSSAQRVTYLRRKDDNESNMLNLPQYFSRVVAPSANPKVSQNGGYLADDMGLGKTIENLGTIVLNRVLLMAQREVHVAR